MKKRLLSFVLTFVMILGIFAGAAAGTALGTAASCEKAYATTQDIAIVESNFPDPIFRAFVQEKYDKNKDGWFSTEERMDVKYIEFINNEASSVEGIEYFPNLIQLRVQHTNLFSIDASRNKNLEELDLPLNKLANVHVNGLDKLTYLNVSRNGSQLTYINVTENPALQVLEVDGNNVVYVNVSENPELRRLNVSNNSRVTYLDLHSNPLLYSLNLYGTGIWRIDISDSSDLVDAVKTGTLKTTEDYKRYYKYVDGESIAHQLFVNPDSGSQSVKILTDKPTVSIVTAKDTQFEPGTNPEIKVKVTVGSFGSEKVKCTLEVTKENGDPVDFLTKDVSSNGTITFKPDTYDCSLDFLNLEATVQTGYDYNTSQYGNIRDTDTSRILIKQKYADVNELDASYYGTIYVYWDEVPRAKNYEIWRKAEGLVNSTLFECIATVSANEWYYEDTKNVGAGTKYTYKIAATTEGGRVGYGKTGSVTVNPFADVKTSDGYFTPISWCYVNNIAKGKKTDSQGKVVFGPKDSCERGQLCTMLYRLNASPKNGPNDTEPFKDVKESDGYYNAIVWAYNRGIINGKSKTVFAPHDACTRGQIVIMLWKMKGKPEPAITKSPFSDVTIKKVGENQYKAILWAYENELVKGYSNGTFRPGNTCTRGQIATILYKYFQVFMGAWG